MPRTTEDLVTAIIEVADGVDLTPYIAAASALVDDFCAGVVSYDFTRLQQIETWLAAHYYTVNDPRTTGETAGTVQEQYQTHTGFGLRTSHYGQMALRLDTNGGLAAFDNRLNTAEIKLPAERASAHIGITWLGTDYPCH